MKYQFLLNDENIVHTCYQQSTIHPMFQASLRRGGEYFSQKLYSFVEVFFDIVDPEVNFWH